MKPPEASTVLAGMALLFLGVIGLILTHCPIPPTNHDYIIYILGALSGAITVGGPRAINALTTNGPNTTVAAPDTSTPPAT